MHTVAAIIIFCLGGMAAIIIIRLLLFHFRGAFFKRSKDDQYLKRIADILQ